MTCSTFQINLDKMGAIVIDTQWTYNTCLTFNFKHNDILIELNKSPRKQEIIFDNSVVICTSMS